jgi:glycosyltransferase involved in cell wall biosynthesis
MLERAPLRLLYRSTPFIAVSASTARELVAHGVPREHITVNYTGLDPERYGPGQRAEEPRLLYLGRLKRYKHIEELLDVLEQIPGAVLDIVGDGDRRPAIEAEVGRRDLSGRVRLHGHVDDATKLEFARRAWVNISASRCEGWGLSVVEAAACGTPTAAIAAGGLAESIEHGRTGLLARNAAELIEHTRRLVADDRLRERMGRAALARAQTFSWEEMAATTLRTLQLEHARANALPEPFPPASGNGDGSAAAQRGAKNLKKSDAGLKAAARR